MAQVSRPLTHEEKCAKADLQWVWNVMRTYEPSNKMTDLDRALDVSGGYTARLLGNPEHRPNKSTIREIRRVYNVFQQKYPIEQRMVNAVATHPIKDIPEPVSLPVIEDKTAEEAKKTASK